MKKNVGTLIVALVIGFILGYIINSGATGPSLNNDAVLKTINEKLVSSPVKATLKDVKNIGKVSELSLDFKGQEDKLYVSNDGSMFFQKIYDSAAAEKAAKAAAAAKVVKNKTDKPEVELFVMSYCPYGTQMEKGYIPAIRALGDSIDSKIKFVNYAMHGEKEVRQNVIQYCIQKEKPQVFNSYLECFLDKGEAGIDTCLKENGLSKKELNDCIVKTTKKFDIQKDLDNKKGYLNGRFPRFGIDDDLNKKYGVQGSPTLVINGQKIDRAGRSPQEVLDIICSAFTDKTRPAACDKKLSSDAPTPGFGYKKAPAGANATDAGCGA